jgi:hypothetical protein
MGSQASGQQSHRYQPGSTTRNRKVVDKPIEPIYCAPLGTLKVWSMKFRWQERARSYDAEEIEEHEANRRAVMENSFALEYNRIEALSHLAELLAADVRALDDQGRRHRMWLQRSQLNPAWVPTNTAPTITTTRRWPTI